MPIRIVAIGALGYFVDILDLFLFSVLRVPSLKDLGIPESELVSAGVWLINWQMGGMLLGSVFWGVRGDRRGRVGVLYSSILLYSVATLANGFAADLTQYTICRFVAGLGLAGELGAAITLVSETLSRTKRGVGTTLVAGFGLFGGSAAALLAESFAWRQCYWIGGTLGLGLFLIRLRLRETPLFEALLNKKEPGSGQLALLLRSPRRLRKYASLMVVGVPIYFVAGILMLFAPELARVMQIQGGATAGKAVFYSYLGVALGDLACGLLSQFWRSRKKAIAVFLALAGLCIALYLTADGKTSRYFYQVCFAAGFTTGYWAVLITMAAEQFGTDLRATVTTTVPNFIRASVIPMTLGFTFLQGTLSLRDASAWVAGLAVLLAFGALETLEETYGIDLDFTEG